jgi:hypothetical protein
LTRRSDSTSRSRASTRTRAGLCEGSLCSTLRETENVRERERERREERTREREREEGERPKCDSFFFLSSLSLTCCFPLSYYLSHLYSGREGREPQTAAVRTRTANAPRVVGLRREERDGVREREREGKQTARRRECSSQSPLSFLCLPISVSLSLSLFPYLF